MIKPTYYQGQDNKDLFDRFEAGLMPITETRGFYKGNIIKYVARYENKNGIQDLEKALTYLQRLIDWEAKLSGGSTQKIQDNSGTTAPGENQQVSV